MRPLRVIDLFAGVGGFSLGLHRAGGYETVAYAEVDQYASAVFDKNFPGVPNLGDVTKTDFCDADIITAGFPCQDVSYAGIGSGLAGERSGLYREVIRSIRLVRPLYAVLENVAALLGRGLATVLGDLAEIGYDAEWHCIPASAVGAPHRRDRVWIIADAGGEQHESHRAPLSGKISEELSRANTDPDSEWEQQPPRGLCQERGWLSNMGAGQPEDTAHADRSGLEVKLDGDTGQRSPPIGGRGQWAIEPDVGRMAHGVPARVDRLRCLGNSVVPQIPEIIGRAIRASIESQSRSVPASGSK